MRAWLLASALVLGGAAQAQDESWRAALSDARELQPELREEVVRIPLLAATAAEQAFPLTGTLYQPAGAGPHPVIVLSHGAPGSRQGRDAMGRYRLLPQIGELVRAGLAVLVPMRRGYGASPGEFVEGIGPCEAPRFAQAGRESARDVLSAVEYVRTRPTLDAVRIVLMGQSAGGFASLAAASRAPAGVVAVVNLAGGRGGGGRNGQPCAPEQMAQVIAGYAATTRVPVLWFYAENDRYFGPAASQSWFAAFQQAGGQGRFVLHPPYGNDGHLLFYSAAAVPIWRAEVRRFLAEQGLAGLGFR